MKRDDSATLLDIAHAAQLVMKFVTGVTQVAFEADELRQSAVHRPRDVTGLSWGRGYSASALAGRRQRLT